MELGYAQSGIERYIGNRHTANNADRAVEQRLAELLRINAESAAERALFRSDRERLEASVMVNPLSSKEVYSYFGYLIGTLPPAGIALKLSFTAEPMAGLFVILIATAGIIAGLVGYATGKYIPAAIASVKNFSLPNRIALLSLIGLVWGAVAGAVGGLFLLVVGAIFAAIVGGIIGAGTLPILVAAHQAVRRGDLMEMRHFLPIGFGITFTLCALILGLVTFS